MKKPIAIGTDFDNSLKCPDCDSENSHHGAVEVFFRDGEDSQRGVHAIIDGDVTINRSMSGNPSARRDGLRIAVQCEQCGYDFSLVIEQHKGVTHVYVEVA